MRPTALEIDEPSADPDTSRGSDHEALALGEGSRLTVRPMTSPFVWHELLTSDPAAAIGFYTSLFGWEPADGGLAVAGRRAVGVRASKLHPHFAPFVRVDDVEAAVAAAAKAGGRVAGRPSAPEGAVLL